MNNKSFPKTDWRERDDDDELIDDFCSGHGKNKDDRTASYVNEKVSSQILDSC